MRSVLLVARIMLLLAVSVTFTVNAAEPPKAEEYAVKSIFIFNFAKYTKWPVGAFPNTDSPLRLCITGDDSFLKVFDKLQGEYIQGRTVVIQHISNEADLTMCHILFIGTTEPERLRLVLASIRNRHILTIGDMPDFAKLGGIINLTRANNKIRFEINKKEEKNAGLQISSKLLQLARIIKSE